MELPPHIIQKSIAWYFNSKKNNWIHADHIEDYCARYWKALKKQKEGALVKVKFNQNLKTAKKRWGL